MSMVHEYKPQIYGECSLSPHTYPVTCASSISECCSRTCSISFGKMFSPPRIIMSLIRPTTCPNPFSCSTNWSLKSILCQLAGPFIPVYKNHDNLAFHISYINLTGRTVHKQMCASKSFPSDTLVQSLSCTHHLSIIYL